MDLGENVSNLTIMAKLLASLTPRFSALQTAWDSVDPARQTLEHLEERLIKEESRLEAEGDEIAAFAVMRINHGKAGNWKNKEDAKSKEGSQDKEEERKARREKRKQNSKCYICQKGHYARACPTRNQNKEAGNEGESSRPVVFMAAGPESGGND